MIRDIAELGDGAALHAEVGIVGAGFAGIDLARHLGRHGVRVVLLESGRVDFDPATQALARLDSVGKPLRTPDPHGGFTPYLDPVFRGESRIRQFGGTSTIWTGKWRALDALTFDRRPWIPHSGWPVGVDELRPFYVEVAREYGLGDADACARDATSRRLDEMCAAGGLTTSLLYWQRDALSFGSFLTGLRRSPHVDVVLGATVTEILLADGRERVRSVDARSLDGRRLTLSADTFVLATGGLEAPRLLLASDRQLPAGIGNGRDLVGRFYMDHPKHKRLTLRPSRDLMALSSRTATHPRPRFQAAFALSPDVQRRESLLNHAISLSPVHRYLVDYPEQEAAALKAAARARNLHGVARSAGALATSPGALSKVVQRHVYRDRRGPVSHFKTTMYVEQAPNPDSRVYLGSERDVLGMRKLVVDWRFTQLDHDSFGALLHHLPDAFARAGLGRLESSPEPLTLDDTVDAAHHIGATRMGASPAEGVVDGNLKVFGTENLYIATSSVFPTGDSATPTFTVVALARRLGTHILRLRAGEISEPRRERTG